MPTLNRRVILARRPEGIPFAGDFVIEETEVPLLGEGEFLVRNLYLSADPVQRGWAANPVLVPIGAPMRALAVGVVLDSRVADVREGDLVYGFFGWQDYSVATQVNLLSHQRSLRAPASAYAGVLGMPGVTAWLALMDLAPPQRGDLILISTAAGAVGSVVGQIAHSCGATAIGLTGSDDKVERCLQRYGYHRAYNYRTIELAATLDGVAPSGFATFFDNTGGWILDTAIRAMAKHGKIIQCGTAATASWSPPPSGLRPEREILTRVLTWSGFYIFDHVARFNAAIDSLSDMIEAGVLVYDEDITIGFDHVTGALKELFAGGNIGKKLIFIADD